MKKIYGLLVLPFLCYGCSTVQVVDLENTEEVADMQNVMQLEYRDWENTADKMVKSMLESNRVDKQNGKERVLVVGRITNDTMQRIDTDLLVKKIRTQLINSGKVLVTTSIATNSKSAEDTMTENIRSLRNNNEYDQNTIAERGTMIAPDMSLTGKIIQRNIEESRKTRVEYYFQMTLTDLKTGLSVWENEEKIIKRGSEAPTW